MKKRILAFLAIVMMLALLTVPAMATEAGRDSPARLSSTINIDDNDVPQAAPVNPETPIEDADAPLAASPKQSTWTAVQTTAAVAGAVGVTAAAGGGIWLFTAYKAGRLGARGLKFVNLLKGLRFWK